MWSVRNKHQLLHVVAICPGGAGCGGAEALERQVDIQTRTWQLMPWDWGDAQGARRRGAGPGLDSKKKSISAVSRASEAKKGSEGRS